VSPTAVAALANPITHRVRISREEVEELNIIRRNVDVHKLVLDLANQNGFSVDIRKSVTAADIELSIDGAHELTITLRDTHRKLQRSRIFHYALDLQIEGWWWRLIRRQKQGDDLTLTFEPRVVSYLRRHSDHKKVRRGKVTRAEFILMLVRAVRKTRIVLYSPELHKTQPVAGVGRDEKQRLDNRDAGLDSGYAITIQNHKYDSSQMKNLERVLDVGTKMKARRKLLVAAMCCVIQESQARTSATNGIHVGLFQQDPRYWPATRDPETDAKAFFKHLIYEDKIFPNREIGLLIDVVQGSGLPALYTQWRDQAEDIVDHYSGSEGSQSRDYKKAYEYKVNKGENYWATIIRLAEEVVWRAFTIKDRLIYMSEEDLFKSKSLMTLTEGKDGVDYIDYDDDDRKEVTTCTVTCRMRMWDAPLGSVVTVDSGCSADGKYLVTALRRSYFSLNGEITLSKPLKAKKEPAPEIGTMSPGKGGSVSTKKITTGSGKGLSYPLPIHGKDLGGVAAHHARAWGNWQSDNAVDIGVPRGTNVVAVDDGHIVKLGGSWDGTGNSNPNGYNITLKTHNNEWFYTHLMHRVALRIGQPVSAGEYLGKSGAANGVNHLHIASMNGDPEKLLGVG
jgi:hypothetical protein